MSVPSAHALQHTLASPISFSGKGLHSGRFCYLTLRPAEAGCGYRFCREDLPGAPELEVSVRHTVASALQTRLVQGDCSVSTVEHVLSACWGLGLDNVVLALTSEEIPAIDGSAKSFVEAIQRTGLKAQSSPRRAIRLLCPLVMEGENGQHLTLSPSATLEIQAEINFPDRVIGYQHMELRLTPERYAREIASARTFGFFRDLGRLARIGLALGAGDENTLIVDDDRILNKEKLAFVDEFVRHKVLDLIGDLALLNAPLLARVEAKRPSHAFTGHVLKTLMESERHWTWETLGEAVPEAQVMTPQARFSTESRTSRADRAPDMGLSIAIAG